MLVVTDPWVEDFPAVGAFLFRLRGACFATREDALLMSFDRFLLSVQRGTESFAELGNLSWLNALISWLWPSFNRPRLFKSLSNSLYRFA